MVRRHFHYHMWGPRGRNIIVENYQPAVAYPVPVAVPVAVPVVNTVAVPVPVSSLHSKHDTYLF